MNRTRQELRDAIFGFLEEREDIRIRWAQKDTDAFISMVDLVEAYADGVVRGWNGQCWVVGDE